MIIDACLVLSLPFPPSVNHYWRWVGRNRVIVSPAGHRYRKAVLDRVFQEKAAGGALEGIRLPLAGRLGLHLTLIPPNRLRRDLDNHIKAVQDALTYAGIWRDDEQIDRLFVQRALPDPQAGVCVTVSVLREDAAHATE